MKTIIAGSRSCTDMAELEAAIGACGWQPTALFSSAARGAARLAIAWANANSVPVRLFPADWSTFGQSAGKRRSQEMIDQAEALIVLSDGISAETDELAGMARAKGLRVHIHPVNPYQHVSTGQIVMPHIQQTSKTNAHYVPPVAANENCEPPEQEVLNTISRMNQMEAILVLDAEGDDSQVENYDFRTALLNQYQDGSIRGSAILKHQTR